MGVFVPYQVTIYIIAIVPQEKVVVHPCLSKNNLECELLDLEVNIDNIECLCVKIKYSKSSNWTNVIGLYCPPSGLIVDFNSLEVLIALL